MFVLESNRMCNKFVQIIHTKCILLFKNDKKLVWTRRTGIIVLPSTVFILTLFFVRQVILGFFVTTIIYAITSKLCWYAERGLGTTEVRVMTGGSRRSVLYFRPHCPKPWSSNSLVGCNKSGESKIQERY